MACPLDVSDRRREVAMEQRRAEPRLQPAETAFETVALDR